MIIVLVEGGLGLPLLDPAVNWGMNSLYERLKPFGACCHLQYEEINELYPILHNAAAPEKIVCIGYSGGGSRLTYFNDQYPAFIINLMILYDPSPAWQMHAINDSVKRLITYENASVETAMMPSPYGMLGAGHTMRIVGSTLPFDRHIIREQHLAVQHDEALHAITLAAIKELAMVSR